MRSHNTSAAMALAQINPESETVAKAMLVLFNDPNEPYQFRWMLPSALAALKTCPEDIEQVLVINHDQASGRFRRSIENALFTIRPQTSKGRALARQWYEKGQPTENQLQQ